MTTNAAIVKIGVGFLNFKSINENQYNDFIHIHASLVVKIL